MSTTLHVQLDDELPPNAGLADQSSTNTRIRAPRFVPFEPSKAATGPALWDNRHNRHEKMSGKKHSRGNHPKSILPNPSTPLSELKRLYPSPHVVYHTHAHSHTEQPVGTKPPTPLKNGGLVQKYKVDDFTVEMYTPKSSPEMKRKVVKENIKNSEKSNEVHARRKILMEDTGPEISGREAQSRDVRTSEHTETVTEALKVTKPISVVDPMKTDDVTAVDINDLESREIERLRRLNDKYNEKVKQIREERNELKKELEVQFQVNTELKKLLVASVGDDLQHRVERLVRERAQLANEISDYCKRIHDDHENIDNVSIQADMWRSKYIASRMMVDELNHTKTRLSGQYKESQHALQGILHERNRMRAHLTDTYRILHHVKDFVQAHGTKKHVYSTNVLSLVDMNRSLAEAIRFKLVGNLAESTNVCASAEDYTQAEVMAMQILHCQTTIDGNQDVIPPLEQMMRPISRFHPETRYDHLTINCCKKCKGDILVI